MLRIVSTKDGSVTLYHTDKNAYYRSLFGAVQESEHVFLKNGLNYVIDKKTMLINILEVGFGTGLNCLLTFLEHEKNFSHKKILYIAIEKYLLNASMVSKLKEYSPFINHQKLFETIHSDKQEISISENFLLKKIAEDVFLALDKISMDTIDVVYYDAFSPLSQPEMWQEDIFLKIYKKLNQGGILVSYCAKGDFKRTLKKAGFKVETLKGAPGKREMTRAIKI